MISQWFHRTYQPTTSGHSTAGPWPLCCAWAACCSAAVLAVRIWTPRCGAWGCLGSEWQWQGMKTWQKPKKLVAFRIDANTIHQKTQPKTQEMSRNFDDYLMVNLVCIIQKHIFIWSDVAGEKVDACLELPSGETNPDFVLCSMSIKVLNLNICWQLNFKYVGSFVLSLLPSFCHWKPTILISIALSKTQMLFLKSPSWSSWMMNIISFNSPML